MAEKPAKHFCTVLRSAVSLIFIMCFSLPSHPVYPNQRSVTGLFVFSVFANIYPLWWALRISAMPRPLNTYERIHSLKNKQVWKRIVWMLLNFAWGLKIKRSNQTAKKYRNDLNHTHVCDSYAIAAAAAAALSPAPTKEMSQLCVARLRIEFIFCQKSHLCAYTVFVDFKPVTHTHAHNLPENYLPYYVILLCSLSLYRYMRASTKEWTIHFQCSVVFVSISLFALHLTSSIQHRPYPPQNLTK